MTVDTSENKDMMSTATIAVLNLMKSLKKPWKNNVDNATGINRSLSMIRPLQDVMATSKNVFPVGKTISVDDEQETMPYHGIKKIIDAPYAIKSNHPMNL